MKRTKSRYDVGADFLCLVLLLGTAVYLMIVWSRLPDKIPAHYNAAGAVDRWGNTGELPVILAIGWMAYLGMTAVGRFPQIWNTGVPVTPENKEAVYRTLQTMLSTLKLLLTAVFSFLTVNSSLSRNLPAWFLPAFLTLVFGSILFFTIKLVRTR